MTVRIPKVDPTPANRTEKSLSLTGTKSYPSMMGMRNFNQKGMGINKQATLISQDPRNLLDMKKRDADRRIPGGVGRGRQPG